MNQFKKLAHATYECKYHIVWCPKYRFGVLTGEVGLSVRDLIRHQLQTDKKVEQGRLWNK